MYSCSDLMEGKNLNWVAGLPDLASQESSTFESDMIPQTAYVDHMQSKDGIYYISQEVIFLDDLNHHLNKIGTSRVER